MILKTGSQEIRVDGDDFVAYNLSSMPWLSRIKKHSMMLDFKTVHPNGLLVYIGSELEQADFLLLDLVRGKLRYDVYFTVELSGLYTRDQEKKIVIYNAVRLMANLLCPLTIAKSSFPIS